MAEAAPSRAQVIEKAHKVVPNLDLDDVLGRLDRYGTEPYEGERERVQLAILKLTQEHGEATLDHYIDVAKTDSRDVLAWAEYPEQMRSSSYKLPADEKARLVRADLEQHQAWLAQ